MEESNLSGLIELLFVVGLVAWFSYSQLRGLRNPPRHTDDKDRAADSKDQPPQDGG
jgi:hypothetical protein